MVIFFMCFKFFLSFFFKFYNEIIIIIVFLGWNRIIVIFVFLVVLFSAYSLHLFSIASHGEYFSGGIF